MKHIMAAVRDIMFKARIADVAKEKGNSVQFVNHIDEAVLAKPDLLIIDLNFVDFQPIESIRKLRQQLPATLKIVCFAFHVDHALQEKAKQVGADTIMPSSRFVVELPQLMT